MAARDSSYEEVWLDGLERKVAVAYDGETVRPLIRKVIARLEVGRERYGDDDFLDKDMVREAIDEVADVIAYMLLETQKRNAGQSEQVDVEDLLMAAFHAAVAGIYIRRSMRPPV